MKTKIVRIGNSRGVRIPKPLLEQAQLGDEVRLRLVGSGIVIEAVRRPRADWSGAAALLCERGEGRMLDEPTPTEFEKTGWVWE